MFLLLIFISIVAINWLFSTMFVFTPVDILSYLGSSLGWMGWAIVLMFLVWCVGNDD